MNDFKIAIDNFYKSLNGLKRRITPNEKSQALFAEWTKTFRYATEIADQIVERIDSGEDIPENYSDYQKIRDIFNSFFELHNNIADLKRQDEEKTQELRELETDLKRCNADLKRCNEEKTKQVRKLEDLERCYKEKTEQVCKLEINKNEQNERIKQLESEKIAKTRRICELEKKMFSPDNTISDSSSCYSLKDFTQFLRKNLSSWENCFPRESSTRNEIDDFKEYLRLAFLRVSSEKVSELKSVLNERYGRYIEEYDNFIDALYDPQRGGRIFGEYGLYLLDLNEEAKGRLFQEDGSYLDFVTVGGRAVKYYDDKRKFVTCKGEVNYRHKEEFDVLFPGFCARCKNSDDIWLLLPPHIYRRPLEQSKDNLAQDDVRETEDSENEIDSLVPESP